jgi:hypothetical protein
MARDRFNEYAEHYANHPHLSWAECQRIVDLAHNPVKAPPAPSESYMRSLTAEEQFDAIYQYQRQSGLAIEDAAATLGQTLDNRPLRLNASGLPDPQFYARKIGDLTDTDIEALLRAASEDGFSESELAHMRRLLEAGYDGVSAYVHAIETRPPGRRDRSAPIHRGGIEDTRTPPEKRTSSADGLDSNFVRDLGTTTLTPSATLQVAPYTEHRIPPRPGSSPIMPAFKKDDQGQRHAEPIAKPEAGALSPKGYQRADYQRRSADGGYAVRTRRCADGGWVEEYA